MHEVCDPHATFVDEMINAYERITGQATMTSLVQRLRNTAQEHNLCVLLLSWSVSYGSDQERVSTFESIKARPGLGKSLGYLVDTQILIGV